MACIPCLQKQIKFADAITKAKLTETIRQELIKKINRKNIEKKEEIIESIKNYTLEQLIETNKSVSKVKRR